MDPSVIDFTPWPGQDADMLRARIADAEAALRTEGLDVTPCLLSADLAAAAETVRGCVAGQTFDVIEIGSGLRKSHEFTLVFERALNSLIALQPGVPLCFNDSPESTVDAVRRGLSQR